MRKFLRRLFRNHFTLPVHQRTARPAVEGCEDRVVPSAVWEWSPPSTGTQTIQVLTNWIDTATGLNPTSLPGGLWQNVKCIMGDTGFYSNATDSGAMSGPWAPGTLVLYSTYTGTIYTGGNALSSGGSGLGPIALNGGAIDLQDGGQATFLNGDSTHTDGWTNTRFLCSYGTANDVVFKDYLTIGTTDSGAVECDANLIFDGGGGSQYVTCSTRYGVDLNGIGNVTIKGGCVFSANYSGIFNQELFKNVGEAYLQTGASLYVNAHYAASITFTGTGYLNVSGTGTLLDIKPASQLTVGGDGVLQTGGTIFIETANADALTGTFLDSSVDQSGGLVKVGFDATSLGFGKIMGDYVMSGSAELNIDAWADPSTDQGKLEVGGHMNVGSGCTLDMAVSVLDHTNAKCGYLYVDGTLTTYGAPTLKLYGYQHDGNTGINPDLTFTLVKSANTISYTGSHYFALSNQGGSGVNWTLFDDAKECDLKSP